MFDVEGIKVAIPADMVADEPVIDIFAFTDDLTVKVDLSVHVVIVGGEGALEGREGSLGGLGGAVVNNDLESVGSVVVEKVEAIPRGVAVLRAFFGEVDEVADAEEGGIIGGLGAAIGKTLGNVGNEWEGDGRVDEEESGDVDGGLVDG